MIYVMEATKYFTLQTKHFLDLVKTKTIIFITNNLLGTIIRHLSCLNKILFIIQRYFGVKKKKQFKTHLYCLMNITMMDQGTEKPV
jgi:hypothetical protein